MAYRALLDIGAPEACDTPGVANKQDEYFDESGNLPSAVCDYLSFMWMSGTPSRKRWRDYDPVTNRILHESRVRAVTEHCDTWPTVSVIIHGREYQIFLQGSPMLQLCMETGYERKVRCTDASGKVLHELPKIHTIPTTTLHRSSTYAGALPMLTDAVAPDVRGALLIFEWMNGTPSNKRWCKYGIKELHALNRAFDDTMERKLARWPVVELWMNDRPYQVHLCGPWMKQVCLETGRERSVRIKKESGEVIHALPETAHVQSMHERYVGVGPDKGDAVYDRELLVFDAQPTKKARFSNDNSSACVG